MAESSRPLADLRLSASGCTPRPDEKVSGWRHARATLRGSTLADLQRRFRALPIRSEIPAEVERRLLGSALARVRWELDRNPVWRRSPAFGVDHALAGPHELLVIPAPLDGQRSTDLPRRVDAVPALVEQPKQALDQMRGPIVRVALEQLNDVRPRLSRMGQALRPVLAREAAAAIGPAADLRDEVDALQRLR